MRNPLLTADTLDTPRPSRVRPDFKKATVSGLLALVAASTVRVFGDLTWSSFPGTIVVLTGSVAFVALAVLAVRSAAGEVASVRGQPRSSTSEGPLEPRGGSSHPRHAYLSANRPDAHAAVHAVHT